jgi:histidinol-phosphate/aromatic aminotransferase/cobyric acid decarboxylase-like protein
LLADEPTAALDEASGRKVVNLFQQQARDRGVAIRDATTFRGLDSHVRVAVRRPAENDRLLAALGVRDETNGEEATGSEGGDDV